MESFSFSQIDEIYFDKKIGHLVESPGDYFTFSENSIFLAGDNDSIIRSQNKLFPLKNLGEDYENVYITYLPAKELDFHPNCEKNIDEKIILVKPLIKADSDNGEKFVKSFQCFLSGKRSAIMIDDKKGALRLKGCGMLNLGFPLANVDDLGDKHLEIRGAQFKNTCLREQFITNLVSKECDKRGLISANIPIGFFKYDSNSSLPKPLVNQAPLCDKYCGLFITRGDKRLGSNFFNGINKILETLLVNDEYWTFLSSYINFTEISKILPQKNFEYDPKGNLKINLYDYLFDNPNINKVKNKEIKEIEEIEEIQMFNLLEYLNSKSKFFLEKDNLFLKLKEKEKSLLLDITKKMSDEKDRIIVTKIIEQIYTDSKYNFLNLIVCVLSKMSYELGLIKKVFEEMDLNWGTYDYHCNAHLDNLLILPKNDKKLYLAPLDFDLGFLRSEFIDLNYKNSKGFESNVDFDGLLQREKNNLAVQLIGFNYIPNIDVKVLHLDGIIEKNSSKATESENLFNLMKENMIVHYSDGYLKNFNQETNTSIFNDTYEVGNLMVKLALYFDSSLY
jgi:hypothetical protein